MVSKLAALRKETNDPTAKPHFYIPSGGNAGLGCVHGAVTLECQATVVVPMSTTQFMIDKLRQAGATEVIQEGATWQEADEYLRETLMPDAKAKGETPVYVPAFDAPEIWEGNAGITHEIVKQMEEAVKHYPVASASPNVDAIVCSVGGGGLFAGVMHGVEELGMSERTKVIAVETYGADSLSQAVAKKELITLPGITSLATSLGARRVAAKAFEYGMRDNVTTTLVTDADGIRACKRFADEEHFLVELACGVCPAICYDGRIKDMIPGFNENSCIVLVVCGGSNMSFEIMEKYMANLGGQ